jgi:hypothetical protein
VIRYLPLILFLLVGWYAQAQAQAPQRGAVSGFVVEEKTSNPVGFASILVIETSRGVMSHENGRFVMARDLTDRIPIDSVTGFQWSQMLDVVRDGRYDYSLRMDNQGLRESYLRTDVETGETTVLHARSFGGDDGAGSAGLIRITSAGRLVNQMGSCDPDRGPNDFFDDACRISIPIR